MILLVLFAFFMLSPGYTTLWLLYHRNAKCWKIVRVVMYGNVCKFEVFLIAEITPCHSVRSTVSVVMLTIVPCLGWCKQAGWQSTGKGLHSQD